MRRTLLFLLSFVALLTSATGLVAQPSTETPAPIREIAIEGPIGPATSAFIERELEQAAAANTPLIILRLDTPGGLDGAMRDIVKAILASPVPVADVP